MRSHAEAGVGLSPRRAVTLAIVLALAMPIVASRAEDRARPSLKGLSNPQLIEFMSLGKSDLEKYEKAPEDHRVAPERFWDLPARDAARSFLEMNQIPGDRKTYELVFDPGSDLPPGRGTLVFCNFSDKSYTDVRDYYFLRFDPERSYFVYAQTYQPGLVGYDLVSAQMSYHFLFQGMDYRDAAHFAQFVWWLTKARTIRTQKGSGQEEGTIFSSADGQGRLALIPEDGGHACVSSGWLTGLPTRLWEGAFGNRARLDSDAYAFERILSSRFPASPLGSSDGTPEERSRLIDLVGSILGLWSPEETKISSWHAAVAVQAVGDLVLVQLRPVLEAIKQSLPPVQPTKRKLPTRSELAAEFRKLEALKDPDEYREKYSDLMQEVGRGDEPRPDSGRTAAEELGLALDLALRKIACANDIPALIVRARAKDEESTWARVRLFEKSPQDLADILEDWMSRAGISEKVDLLYAIFRTAPERAEAIAERVSLGTHGLLRAAAADILSKAGQPDSLIKIVRDPQAGREELEAAIAHLVPAEDPDRFPGRAVDDALIVALKNPEGAADCAARALAWRKRSDQLDPMCSLLESMTYENGDDEYERVLSAVTYLTRLSGPAEKRRLARLLLRNFARKDIWHTEFFLSAWSADLKDLASKLDRMATASPPDYEKFGGGRYHPARKIAALWSEPDLLTRGKLLIAFGLKEPSIVDLEHPERGERMREELGRLAGAALPAEKDQLSSFLAWCESDVVGKDPDGDREAEEAFVRLAQKALGLTAH